MPTAPSIAPTTLCSARRARRWRRVRSSLALSKRHGTIYRRFDKHLVQERGFDPSLGRGFLSKQRWARQRADYEEGRVDETVARAVVGDMDRFLAAVEPLLQKVKQ